MDPLCHTLVGASLAGTRLGERTWGAGLTLVVAANLPDVDVAAYARGADFALGFRRGWTHGIPALVILPLLLAGIVYAVGRLRGADGLRGGQLVLLACLGLATHPALDWLNTYGMRWLMPFDGRWFYGDALFIVDPWLWLILGGASFLRFSETPRSATLWGLLAVLASVPVLSTGAVPVWGRALWTLGLVALASIRWLSGPLTGSGGARACTSAVGLAILYVVGMLAGNRHAEDRVLERITGTPGVPFLEVFVGPVPGDPLTRDLLLIGNDRYLPGSLDLLGEPWFRSDPILRLPADPRVAKALSAPCARGMRTWLRYPFSAIEEAPEGGSVVYLLDARYVREPTTGFGSTRVRLAEDGTVLGCS